MEPKSSHLLWLITGLFYVFMFLLLLVNSYSYLDPDLGWHLRVGQEISQTQAVPRVDHYDDPLLGQSWADHEWLTNLGAWLVLGQFGFIGLHFAFAWLILFTLFLWHYFVRKEVPPAEKNKVSIIFMVLSFAGLFVIFPSIGLRVQEWSLFFLSLLALIIYRYSKTDNYWILLWLGPLFYFWSMLHGSFLFGLFLLGFTASVKIVELIIYQHQNKLIFSRYLSFQLLWKLKKSLVLFGGLLLAFGMTLLTPYGFYLYQFLFGYRDLYYTHHIQEWLPLFNFPIFYFQWIFMVLISVFILFRIWGLVRRQEKVDLLAFSLLILLFYMGMSARRNIPLLVILSLPFFTLYYSYQIKVSLKIKFIKLTVAFLAAVLAVCSLYYLDMINWPANPFFSFSNSFPNGAVTFLNDHPQYNNLKMFDDYGWGGFLMWMRPGHTYFIDGRLPQYQLNGHSFLEEYNLFYSSNHQIIANKLQQYNIGLVLIKNYTKSSLPISSWWDRIIDLTEEKTVKSELLKYLENSPDWLKIYSDQTSVIFIKK
jgi:hypothetical protein